MAAAGALQLRRLAAAAAAVSSSASHHHASSARAVAGAAAGAALTSARAAGVAGRRPGAWQVATTSVAHYRVLFMGTDDVSLVTLRALHDAMVAPRPGGPTVQSLAVLCPSDRPAGRGKHNTQMPVKAFAAAAGLPTAEVPYGMCVTAFYVWCGGCAHSANQHPPPPRLQKVAEGVDAGVARRGATV